VLKQYNAKYSIEYVVSSIESNTNQYKIIQLIHLKDSNSNTVSSQNRMIIFTPTLLLPPPQGGGNKVINDK